MTDKFHPNQPLVLGIMGGIASGKSTVSAILATQNLLVVDADAISAEISARPSILTSLKAAFPAKLFEPNGGIDRRAMAALVFSDQAAKKTLQGILHPHIQKEIDRNLEAALAEGRSVVLDAPLLLEGGLIERCDLCLYVQADDATRLSRAKARGWSAKELRQREENQAHESVKIARSAYTIDNSGTIAMTRDRVLEILADLESNPPP